MITHEIKKPFLPVTRLQHVKEVISNVLGNRTSTVRDPRQDREQGAGCVYMSKHGYAMWIEGEVRPRFPKNSLCTLRGLAYIPGHLPEPMYRVQDIQEIHWMAPIDPGFMEPKALFVVHADKNYGGWWCPCGLRPLTKEEYELVNARNKAKTPIKSEVVEQASGEIRDVSIDTGDNAG